MIRTEIGAVGVILSLVIGVFSIAPASGINGNYEVVGVGVGVGPPAPPPAFKGGVNILTPAVMMAVIKERVLERKPFYDFSPFSLFLAAPMILVGEYPAPTTPLIHGILTEPIKSLTEVLKPVREAEAVAPEAINEMYAIYTTKVLRKYTYAGTVVIARRDPPVDSMAAIAYARSINAPILLTEEDELPEATLTTVKKLGATKIIIVGGPVAVSYDLENEFKKIASVERIWGATRYETAIELANKIDPEVIVITDGTDPSIDAVIVAAEYKAPIVYVRSSEIPQTVRDYLLEHKATAHKRPMKWVVAGVNEDVSTEINALYVLPEFLTKHRVIIKLYQLGTRV
jgi:putative cell wall-binding protein